MYLRFKKKKNKRILELGESMQHDESKELFRQLEMRILKTFKGHVGEINSITPRDLFTQVFKISPENMNIYKREYWWKVIMKKLHKFRKNDKMFVINKGKYLFVLQSKQESNTFRYRIDNTIKALENIQDKADVWVQSNKWREFI